MRIYEMMTQRENVLNMIVFNSIFKEMHENQSGEFVFG